MVEVYKYLLILICLGILGWGIIRVERIYQYPFFMGALFTSFIVPQAFALIDNPGQVSKEALERVLFVACLCVGACWLGYEMKPNRKWLAFLNITMDERKLFRAGIVLMLIGWLSNFLLARTIAETDGVLKSGTPATIYYLFTNVSYIAFAIFLLQLFKHPNIGNFIYTLLAGWYPFQQVLIGRRQPTMTFIIVVGVSLFLIRRYTPPRWAVVTAIVMIGVLIPLFAEIRGEFWNLVFSGNWEQIQSLSQKAFATQQKGEILELRNAALLIDAVERTNMYGYGTGFWDSIVFQYVPAQILGAEFKKSLQFNLFNPDLLKDLYGYSLPKGVTVTAIGDSFMEFGYFGCLILATLGYIFKHLWISSIYQKSYFSRLLYIGLISPSMIAITHGIGRFCQEAIFQVGFVCLVAYYCRSKNKFYYNHANMISE